jgi:thiol-disulfide isomerase/thioredoxin
MTLPHLLRTFAICITFGCCLDATASDAAPDMPKAGDVAPRIVGKTADDDIVDLSQYKGKVVVISFWATWCGYCLKELPVLENIQKAAGAEQIQVLAVNTEPWDVFRQVRKGLKGLTMGLIYDPAKTGQKAYRVSGIPHMVIIGRDGRIIQVHRGYGESSLDAIVVNINNALQAKAKG